MATRFVHTLFAYENIQNISANEKEQCLFFLGNIYPDLVKIKKSTHFKTEFLDTIIKNKQKDSSYYFYLGWKCHIIADDSWRTSLFHKQLWYVAYTYLRFGLKTAQKYYYQLSYLDTLLQNRIDHNKIVSFVTKTINNYSKEIPNTLEKISLETFIEKFTNDLEKKDIEPKTRIVLDKTFLEYYKNTSIQIANFLKMVEEKK